jgi:hypothetical protein
VNRELCCVIDGRNSHKDKPFWFFAAAESVPHSFFTFLYFSYLLYPSVYNTKHTRI